jgi:hypothetical protein
MWEPPPTPQPSHTLNPNKNHETRYQNTYSLKFCLFVDWHLRFMGETCMPLISSIIANRFYKFLCEFDMIVFFAHMAYCFGFFLGYVVARETSAPHALKDNEDALQKFV